MQIRLALSFVIACLLSGSAQAQATLERAQTGRESGLPAVLASDDPVRFRSAVDAELRQQHFDVLDNAAEEFRTRKLRFPGGDWKLAQFYGALALNWNPSVPASEKELEERVAALRLWQSKRPKSAAAVIALAESLTSLGWKARGDGFADTVTDDGARLFDERLSQAQRLLLTNKAKAAGDPAWYRALLIIARGLAWEREDADAVFEEAMKIEPLFQHTYGPMAIYLLPRWHGEAGEWERFADVSTRRVGGRAGAAIYAHIAWTVSKSVGARAFFKENRVQWPRIRQSFIDREALFGVSQFNLNAFCLLAGRAVDLRTTRELLARIGESWDPLVWNDKRYFDEYREWAARTP